MSSPAADDATRRAGTMLTIDLAAIAANWRGLRDASSYRDKYYLMHEEPKRRDNEITDYFNQRYDDSRRRCEQIYGKAEVIVAKQRHGPVGIVGLAFEGQHIKFDNLPAERAGLRVTACIVSAFARPPERALDKTEQCCGVCLPILMQGSSASMFCHRIRSASAPRGRRPAVVSRGGERRKLAAPSSGTQELPIAIGRTDAMLCRPAAGHGGSAIRRSAGPVAVIAEIHRASRANPDARCAQLHSGTCEGVALIALIALTPCMHCCHSLRQG
jgi:DnaB-like helicase C terminal domain